MAKLYEIGVEYERILNEIDGYAAEHDGEVDIELWAKLQAIDGDFDAKIENYVRAIRNYESDAAMYGAEADRLKKKADTAKKSKDYLKSALLGAMTAVGKDKTETAIAKVRVQMDKSTKITDETLLPPEYIIAKVETKIDRASILRILKDGGTIPGAELEERPGIRIS